MIYGFIRDEALFLPPATGSILKPVVQNQGYGFADEDILSLFLTPVEIPDTRASRMTISQALAGKGRMSIITDDAETRDRDVAIDGLSTQNIEAIFGVIEKMLYLIDGNDTAAINAALVGMTGFKANSATRSSTSSNIKFVYEDNSVESSKKVYDWIAFSMEFDTTTVDFKLWCKKTTIMSGYPFTDIVKILFPANMMDLYNGAVLSTSALTALRDAGTYNKENLIGIGETSGDSEDYTGIKYKEYQYTNGASINTVSLPFGVFYKGRPPTDSDCQAKIRDVLTALPNTNNAGWTARFAGIFTTSTFYLVPIWTSRGTNLVNATVPNSIVKWADLVNIPQSKYTHSDASWMTDNYLATYAEVLTVPGLPFLVLAIPDDANIGTNKSAKALIGDEYNSVVPSGSTTWNNMSADAKEFYQKISTTVALMENASPVGSPIASGKPAWLDDQQIFDLLHYKFTAGSAIYAVLHRFSA